RRSDRRYANPVGREIIADIDRHRRPQRLSNRQYPWPSQFAAFDPLPERESVLQYGGNIENCGKAPPVEHRVKLLVELSGVPVANVEQTRRNNVHMAVPKTGDDEFAGAVKHLSIFWDFGRRARTDACDPAVMNHDYRVANRLRIGRGINCSIREGKIAAARE